jgi:acyl carrier protein
VARQISQRIEVLLKKASVDPAFKAAFLELRGEAALEIGLTLEPAEATMLRLVPREQLEAIIAKTSVPEEHRRAFLGQAAAAMLSALVLVAAGSGNAAEPSPASDVPAPPMFGGVRPDSPPSRDPNPDLPPGGIRPDLPEKKPKTIDQRVIGVMAKQLKVHELLITRNKKPIELLLLVEDLGAKPPALVQLRTGLEKEFDLKIPTDAFKKVQTAGETIDYVKKAIEKRAAEHAKQDVKAAEQPQPPTPAAPVAPYPMAGGVRPH